MHRATPGAVRALRGWHRIAAAILLTALPAAAQSPRADSLPFRRGQWGARFEGGDGFRTLGVLRFRTPRTAWLLDGWFSVEEDRPRYSYDGRSEVGLATSTTRARLQVGQRAYRAGSTRVAGFRTIGVLLDTYVFHLPYRDTPDPIHVTASAGVYGDVGASYLITPHLGLGASAGAQVTYGRSFSIHSREDGARHHWGAHLGGLRLEVAMYF